MDLQTFTEKKIPKFTETQERFVVSLLIAGKSDLRIARDFLEFFPHFNGAVDKAKCEQGISRRCYQFRRDPTTPQYKTIWQARRRKGNDSTHVLMKHQRWRDHERQNFLCAIKNIGDIAKEKKEAKVVIDCHLMLIRILDNYDKLEVARRQLYGSTEVH